jgi:hypothetical protein
MRKTATVTTIAALGLGLALLATGLGTATTAVAATPSDHPTRGMSMSQVEARYGAPAERHAAVGAPPITRWDYPSFVVFFEYQHVVHAVLLGPPPAAAADTPAT